ncbi:TPA: LysE family transporter [Candidatus Bathyarchaeota archaeon]|nr:LysE family transporter [Candidatus Bathyarchaeota archaeon]
MALVTDFYGFLISVVFISLSGVLLPGPLFAITLKKAAKQPFAGALIALGHGMVEFPLMFLIYFGLSQVTVIPPAVEITIGLAGGLVMIFMGVQTFRNRTESEAGLEGSTQDSIIGGIWTTAANPGFILWWVTVGTALIMTARQFYGIWGFSVFAGVHWLCDFAWYTLIAVLVFKSVRFWSSKVHKAITLFCVGILLVFGILFMVSAINLAVKTIF